ncbi:MAG: hypothetical protein Q3974_04015 [Rothia sp. (in: high G+C Gram-positive bacteria)]|nr:hypothetical protein [Rothia sp. (in: high G+C Gram-positive bacteria)]
MGLFDLSGLRRKTAQSQRQQKSSQSNLPKFSDHHVLFICTGNIARSAAAEILARSMSTESGWTFSSAGIGAVVNHPVAQFVDVELTQRQGDIASHRGKQVTYEMLQQSTLVLVMEIEHLDWIIREWPEFRPKIHLLKQMARLRNEAGRRADPISFMQTTADIPSRKDNIADPYRKGPSAAAQAVREIEAALEVIVPWLGTVNNKS